MKKLILALLLSTSAFAIDIGQPDQPYVTPHAGGRAKFGKLDLTKSAAISTQTVNGILYGSSTGAVANTAAGSQYQVCQAGSGGVPTVEALHLDQSAATTGLLPAAAGGTNQNSIANAFISFFESVATTAQDLVIGGSGGTPTRLPKGSDGQLLTMVSGAIAWHTPNAVVAPSVTRLTSTGTAAGYLFTVSAANATAGATYTNNSNTYTVLATIAGGTQLFTSQASAPLASGTLTKASGSGDATITFSAQQALAVYTTPTGPAPLYLKVLLVGGGGGGGAGTDSGSGGKGGSGTPTAFGAALLIGNGGEGGGNLGCCGNQLNGVGGTASIGAGASGIAMQGNSASAGTFSTTNNQSVGGAAGPFGGAGSGAYYNHVGGNAAANSGAGGGGGPTDNNPGNGGGGGASGGYVDAIIPSPVSTYYYTIGAAGSAGTGNDTNGGSGGSGVILVEEHYQ